MPISLTEQILCLGKAKARPSRQHDHLWQRQGLLALFQHSVGWITVIGVVTMKPIDPASHLIQKLTQSCDITEVIIRQFRSDDLAIVRIHAEMKLLPGLASLRRITLGCPFAGHGPLSRNITGDPDGDIAALPKGGLALWPVLDGITSLGASARRGS